MKIEHVVEKKGALSIVVGWNISNLDTMYLYFILFFTLLQYKFGDQLKSLLEVAGAKTISFQEFSSISQVCI